MVPWFGWMLDVRVHLTLIATLIAAVVTLDRPRAAPEVSWRAGQLALLRQEPKSSQPHLPVVSNAAAEEMFSAAEGLAE